MGSTDEFGPDTESIRAWLAKRASYADDARIAGAPRGVPASAAPTAPAPTPDPVMPVAGDRLDATGLGRAVVAALRTEETPPERGPDNTGTTDTTGTTDATTAAEPVPPRDPVRPPPPPRVRTEPEIRRGRWTEPDDNLTAAEASTDVTFPVRRGVRRALSSVLLVVLAGTALASYAAAREPSATTVGLAALLAVLLLVVWAVRASTTPAQLAIRRGQLTITRNGRTEIVDVASPYTPIAIVGEPSERRWTVLIERDGLPLVVVTRSLVDPHWFESALYRLRPELRPEPAGAASPGALSP